MSDDEFVAALRAFSDCGAHLAEVIGVSVPTMVRWLNKENLPHPSMREAIVKVLE